MIYTSINIKAEERILDLRSISLKSKKDVRIFTEFLNSRDLEMDDDIDYAIVLEENEKIVASGAMSGSVLKCIAVDRNYEGEGYIGKIVTYLLLKAHHENSDHLFLFTKPENEAIFSDLGFYGIAKVDGEAILMENMKNGLADYLEKLSQKKVPGDKIASIVMNCNPFTKGHLFLIEKTAAENDHVHIFLLDENRSLFPADVRMDLVKKGTAHLENVTVHHSGQYVISAATFPSYFLKDSERIIDAHGRMDLTLFRDRIAPALGINRRYVGEEPLCPVTSHYNGLMAEILPSGGIELIVIKRKEQGDGVISASRVRKLIARDDFDAIAELVPPATLHYLKSPQAEPVIKRIKGLNT
ncbi:MAG: [citrate (pro-3S)-lyase] ligase [Spirochaetales bacterium]|nr:[citrate (pro-3S)-lyase] ligase [Spirochaetales bacterium]